MVCLGGVGMGKLGLILAAALIILKPRDFLEIAQILGATMAALRQAVDKLLETAQDLKSSELEEPTPSGNG